MSDPVTQERFLVTSCHQTPSTPVPDHPVLTVFVYVRTDQVIKVMVSSAIDLLTLLGRICTLLLCPLKFSMLMINLLS